MEQTPKLFEQITLTGREHGRKFLMDIRVPESTTSAPMILFIHGFKGFKDWGTFNKISEWFARQGFGFAKLNLSHNGTTPEQPMEFVDLQAFSRNTFSMELNDIGQAIDMLSDRSGSNGLPLWDASRLFIMGHSRGGALAILKASEDPRIRAVSALAPIDDLKKRYPQKDLEEWKKHGIMYISNTRTGQQMPLRYDLVLDVMHHADRLNIPGAVETAKIPMLIFHGTDDETLPVEGSRRFHGVNEHVSVDIIEGANHVFGGSHPYDSEKLPEDTLYVLEKTRTFFEKLV